MSGLPLYGTCEAIVAEVNAGVEGHPRWKRVTCDRPATHEAPDHEGEIRLCDEHTRQLLRDPGHARVRRLDQGGSG